MAINSLPILLLIAALVSVVGAALTLLALRGRLVATGPHCRACRFDLRGITLNHGRSDAAAPVCPECGRDIAGPADTLNGLRERSRTLMLLGLVLALGPWAAVGLAAYTSGRAGVVALKPDWWLLAEIRSMPAASVGQQLVELRSRMQNGSLAASHRRRLIERALAVQADRSARWIGEWGDVLEAAAVAGVLTDEQTAAYARNAPSIHVSARPRIAVGDPLVVQLAQAGARIGGAPFGPTSLQFGCTLESIRFGDRTIVTGGGGMQSDLHPSAASSTVSRHSLPVGGPGDFDVVATWKFTVCVAATQTTIAEWTEEHTLRISVEPRGTDIVELIDDDALDAQVRAAVAAPRGVRVAPAYDGGGARRHVSLHVECRDAPVDLAFEVILRERPDPAAPDKSLREWNLGRSTFRAGGSTSLGTGMDVPPIDVAAVDIVLRPSKAAARESIDVYRTWAREVVIENVPVHPAPADGGTGE